MLKRKAKRGTEISLGYDAQITAYDRNFNELITVHVITASLSIFNVGNEVL